MATPADRAKCVMQFSRASPLIELHVLISRPHAANASSGRRPMRRTDGLPEQIPSVP